MSRQIESIRNMQLGQDCRLVWSGEGGGLVCVDIERRRREMFAEIEQARRVLEKHYKSWFDPTRGIIRLQRPITDQELDVWAWEMVARIWVEEKDVTWRETE